MGDVARRGSGWKWVLEAKSGGFLSFFLSFQAGLCLFHVVYGQYDQVKLVLGQFVDCGGRG